MTISYVGAAGAEASSVSLFTHQAGDILIAIAYGVTGSVVPSIPSGWSRINSNLASARGSTIAYKIAASASEVSGTWTNAEILGIAGYRDDTNYILPGNSVRNGGSGTSVGYGNLVAPDMPVRANAWVLAMAACQLNSVTLEGTPTSMTNRLSTAGASTKEIVIHDTNAVVSTYAYNTVTVSGSVAWQAYLFDLFDTGISKSGGSGGLILPRLFNGGY
jgi:hypothetical protein